MICVPHVSGALLMLPEQLGVHAGAEEPLAAVAEQDCQIYCTLLQCSCRNDSMKPLKCVID